MNTEKWSLAWLHLALAVAVSIVLVACREFVEWPWLALVAGMVAGGLWWQQTTCGKQPMGEWVGNILGTFIAVFGGLWAFGQASELKGLPPAVALIPFLGLLVPPLMLIKLLKRQIPRDYWVLQGMGVVMSAIGCILGLEKWEWSLLPIYALFALGSLRFRPGQASWDARSFGFADPGRPLFWAMAVALSLFFFLPRPEVPLWNPSGQFGSNARGATGASNEMDLTGTGTLDLDAEVAFEVDVKQPPGVPGVLPADSRFRMVELELYSKGRWRGNSESTAGRGIPMASSELPSLGPNQMLLTFNILSRDVTTPVVLDQQTLFLPVPIRRQGRLDGMLRREYAYQQIAAKAPTSDRMPVQDEVGNPIRRQDLLSSPPELRTWTRRLIPTLADRPDGKQPEVGPLRAKPGRPGRLPLEIVGGPDGLPDDFYLTPRIHEEVARRICDYLANSGDYTYSLDRKRSDSSIDPGVDFLKNVKEGHCERFASGLALALRSLGIPARVVKGFRGLEEKEEGVYLVRNYHAHSWVEVLIPRRDPAQQNGNMRAQAWEWLVLDPTPSGSDPETLSQAAGVAAAARWVGLLPLLELLDKYYKAGMGDTLYGLPALVWILVVFLGIPMGLFLIWRLRRSQKLRAWRVWPLWLRVARKLGVIPAVGATPREIALAVSQKLPPDDPSLGDGILAAAEFGYRLRYGDLEPTRPETLQEADRLIGLARKVRVIRG